MFWKYSRQNCFIFMEIGVLHYRNFVKIAAKLLPGVGKLFLSNSNTLEIGEIEFCV